MTTAASESSSRIARSAPFYLFTETSTHEVPVAPLRDVDPHLTSLANGNCAADYPAAGKLEALGLDADVVVGRTPVRKLGAPRIIRGGLRFRTGS